MHSTGSSNYVNCWKTISYYNDQRITEYKMVDENIT